MKANPDRSIRVFISSTFRDMQAERDYLIKFIFPQLRKLCEQRGVAWSEVDLRWGITDEQSAEGQVLPICLEEIRHCRPYFIGILGERYGWVPEAIDPELIAREPWLAEYKSHSVTELEILHGVLNDLTMKGHTLFYFRDAEAINHLPSEQQQLFSETAQPDEIERYGLEEAQKRAADRKTKLAALKDRIRQSELPLKENFRDPQELGDWVLSDLTAIIDQQYPQGSQPDPLARIRQTHTAFASNRLRIYIGGEKYFSQLDAHIFKNKVPLAVTGESGVGKSALLANWELKYRQEHPHDLVIMHFCSASANSSDWINMLRHVMGELKQFLNLKDEIPEDADALRKTFPQWLYQAGLKGKVVLILDALNQLEDRQGAQELTWLPPQLPENVAMILSMLPGKVLQVCEEREYPTLTVKALMLEERKELAQKFLSRYSKSLTDVQLLSIITAPQSSSPLGLRILLDELRQFGVYEQLDERINHYIKADSIPALLGLVLDRCKGDFENDRPNLVGDALSCIWAARQGISEMELLDMLGKDGQPLPQRIWSPLHLALEGSLFEREGLIDFSHDYIKKAVEQRYLTAEGNQQKAHIKLADYFTQQSGTLRRKVMELPWQLQQAQAWERLYKLLSDLDFFTAVWEENHFDVYSYWTSVEQNSAYDRTTAYQVVIQSPDDYDLHLFNWLAVLYKDSGKLQEALRVHEVEERKCRQKNDRAALQFCLGNRALILKTMGELDQALTLLKEKESICKELNDWVGLTTALDHQALILKAWGKLDDAMRLFKLEETFCRNNKDFDGLQRCLGNQANILFSWGEFNKSMQYHKEEERICHEIGNLYSLQISLGNQANIYLKAGDLKNAWKYHQEKERICRQLGDLDSLQNSLGNQALILYQGGKVDEAIVMLKEQESICRKLGNKESLSISLGNQAAMLKSKGRLQEALELHKEEERLSEEMNSAEGLCYSWVNQGTIYLRLNERSKGLKLMQNAYALAVKHGYTALASQIKGTLIRYS